MIPPNVQEQLRVTVLRLVAERGAGRTVDPSEIARIVGGPQPGGWGPLMQPLRRIAVELMKAGKIVILRRGKPVDPGSFKGVYRLSLPSDGPGNS
ncbi:DUF3253 domain-containing protein [Microvirga massiliensis]|uniref:DUF3253 domain-containing protein n=1 Tax=Microvirga massiliensis TaxID=1033741 RepID=UPI0007C6F30B|nr:DUF3253 domain-containing protein [Microvirga massiliensis]